MDTIDVLSLLSMKMGVFMDEKLKNQHLVHKKGTRRGRDEEIKKRHPERMSLYLALSREGRLKNRGRPWPREREGPNAVGRDLVFQPPLPAITY